MCLSNRWHALDGGTGGGGVVHILSPVVLLCFYCGPIRVLLVREAVIWGGRDRYFFMFLVSLGCDLIFSLKESNELSNFPLFLS